MSFKKTKYAVLAAFLILSTSTVLARNTTHHIPLQEVLNMPEAAEKLDGSVKFFLSGQKTPKILETKNTDFTNKKTNGAGKDDETGCKWAALSALIALQDKAKQVGANAVVNLHSFYKRKEFTSPTDFECHAGAFVIGVALRGTYAKVASK